MNQMTNDIAIKTKTIELIKKSGEYYLKFFFDALNKVKINIFFFAEEIVEENTQLIIKINKTNPKIKNSQKIFGKGLNQEFPLIAKIDLDKIKLPLNHSKSYYPLIIKMTSLSELNKFLYTYCSFKINEDSNNIICDVIKQKIEEKNYQKIK